VRTLLSANLPAGWHSTTWDGRDDVGRPAPNGVYLVELSAGHARSVKRAVLVR
jgi:flagellar hook assembly protein FlgD